MATITPREIEKLQAVGLAVEPYDDGTAIVSHEAFIQGDEGAIRFPNTQAAAEAAMRWALTKKGMQATMADKVRWLNNHFKDGGSVELWGGDDPACQEDERFIAEVRHHG